MMSRIIIIYPHIKLWLYRTMLNFCDIVVAILKIATSRNCSMSGINSGHHHWTISTGRHFQNGHHNTANIQHCPISSQFDMWVDNDVLNWFPTLNNFYWLLFSKWPRRNFPMSGINSGHHYLPTYQIVMISDNVDFLRYCGGHFENSNQ
jgi:hypothetical protein